MSFQCYVGCPVATQTFYLKKKLCITVVSEPKVYHRKHLLFSFGSRTEQMRYDKVFLRFWFTYPGILMIGSSSLPLVNNFEKSISIWWAWAPLKWTIIWMQASLWRVFVFLESTLSIHFGRPITCRTSSKNWALTQNIDRLVSIELQYKMLNLHHKFRRFL